MAQLLYIVLFSCLWNVSLQISTPQDSEYVAAVVEYQVSRDVEQNRINYIQLIQQAASQNADIIVFPELTLTNSTTSFPVPIHGLLVQYPIPALYPDLYDNLLVSMSAAARDNQIYVVINVRELMDCTTNSTGELCPEARQYVFNTNVVFDRTGRVIDRYRKINLFGEASHTPALQPDLGHFETDFGVTFAHFICFDLMFQVPAIQSVQKLNVKDVVFTTMWFSELPYLTAVQIQESYAYTMNVNLLASGANNVAVGSAGSGIYSGKAGALVSIMPGVPTTRLLVSRVPKTPGQLSQGTYPGPIYDDPASHDGLLLITDPSLVTYVSRQLTSGFQEFTLTDKDVSCKFTVRLTLPTTEPYPHFRAIIQDGKNTYARRELGIVGCSIISCLTDKFKTCGHKYDTNAATVQIEELTIEMTTYSTQYNSTLQCDNVVYFPMSIRNSKFPTGPNNFTFYDEKQNELVSSRGVESQNDAQEQDGDRTRLVYMLTKPQKDLISFGIWGRLYLRDVNHNKNVTKEDEQKFTDIINLIYDAPSAQGNTRDKLIALSDDHKQY